MDPEKGEEGVPQPAGPPTRKKFIIPLDEDEVPPAGVGREDGGPLGGAGWGETVGRKESRKRPCGHFVG
jgi:hypothetical protein